MLKKILIALTLSLVVLAAIGVAMPLWGVSAQAASHTARSPQRAGSAAATAAPTGDTSKDDCGKRKRENGSRSQPA